MCRREPDPVGRACELRLEARSWAYRRGAVRRVSSSGRSDADTVTARVDHAPSGVTAPPEQRCEGDDDAGDDEPDPAHPDEQTQRDPGVLDDVDARDQADDAQRDAPAA